MTDKADWLTGLTVGDVVVVKTWPHKSRLIRRVSRFTKTLIVTDGGSRYRQKDGMEPGDLWRTHWIVKPTAAQARKASKGGG